MFTRAGRIGAYNIALIVALAILSSASAATFSVNSTSGPQNLQGSGFYDTGLTLLKDQALVIDASGSFNNGVAEATAAGFPNAPDPQYGATVLPSIASNSLVGGIGTYLYAFDTLLPNVATGVHGNGYVGASYRGSVPRNGKLFFAINDTPLDDNTGSLSVVVKTPTCEEILENAVSAPVIGHYEPLNRDYIQSTLTPNFGLSLRVAAKACGFDHFNYLNWIKYPDGWEIKVDETTVKAADTAQEKYDLPDPVIGNHTRTLIDPRTGLAGLNVKYDSPPDSNPGYWDEGGGGEDDVFVRNPPDGTESYFSDSPAAVTPELTYVGTEGTRFFTQLVGVDAAGTVVKTFPKVKNANFYWKSTQMVGGATPTGKLVRESTDINEPGLDAVISGGIGDVQVLQEGDYNYDGLVDGADMLLWQNQLGDEPPVFESADGDMSDLVDGGDLTVWEDGFGSEQPIAVAAGVPEPGAALLAVAAILACCVTRRQLR